MGENIRNPEHNIFYKATLSRKKRKTKFQHSQFLLLQVIPLTNKEIYNIFKYKLINKIDYLCYKDFFCHPKKFFTFFRKFFHLLKLNKTKNFIWVANNQLLLNKTDCNYQIFLVYVVDLFYFSFIINLDYKFDY